MNTLEIITRPEVTAKFESYPDHARQQMLSLRALVLETAKDIPNLTKLKETLKWGEPSFVTPIGSPLRMDWKSKAPHQYALYFQCNSRLVETFKLVFKSTFTYEGKRALIFNLEAPLPKEALKHCITAALVYHSVKQLPTLGL